MYAGWWMVGRHVKVEWIVIVTVHCVEMSTLWTTLSTGYLVCRSSDSCAVLCYLSDEFTPRE